MIDQHDPIDCHGGPGTTQDACGGCIACLHRLIEGLESERDALKQNRDEWRKLAEMLIELQSGEFQAGGEAMIDKQRDAADLYRKLKESKP